MKVVTLMEVVELISDMEKFGVTARRPCMRAGLAAAAALVEEKTEFAVTSRSTGGCKAHVATASK